VRIALLCPGQGAQSPGFLQRLPRHAAVAATLDEASAALGQDVRSLDGAAALQSTVAVQLTTVVAGVAAGRVLAAEGGPPDAVAGLSVGTFTAAVLAGALPLADAVRVVRLRAELMEGAFPRGFGLAAVVGLPERRVAALVAAVTGRGPLHVANVNAPAQIVVAGADAALDEVLVRARGAGARRTERMAVAVPSHCALLAPVAARLAAALREVALADARVPYVTSGRARPTRDRERIRDDLARNVMEPVRWHDATTVLVELGVRLFLEVPPGRTLATLAAEAFPEARAVAVEDAGAAAAAALARRERRLEPV
jgi:malonate decarboxylase epsilon subunit